MNLYLESSALLAVWFDEPSRLRITPLLRAAEVLITSELTQIECDRAFRRAHAGGRLAAGILPKLQSTAAELWEGCALLRFEAGICARARQAFPGEPLRSLDALHLAFCEKARQILPDVRLLSLDQRIRAIARALQLPTLPA